MKVFFIDDKLENAEPKGFHHKIDGAYGYSRTMDKVALYKQLNIKSPIYTNCPMLLLQVENDDVLFWTGYRFENKRKLIDKSKDYSEKSLLQMFIDGDIKHAKKDDWRCE
jgi:hypothetical protein